MWCNISYSLQRTWGKISYVLQQKCVRGLTNNLVFSCFCSYLSVCISACLFFYLYTQYIYIYIYIYIYCVYKVVQIWPGKTVTCLLTNSPGHIWTTLYIVCQTRTALTYNKVGSISYLHANLAQKMYLCQVFSSQQTWSKICTQR
jgi:hypothetical protein